ncbi:MAG: EutN/CcmL family microcompartment protein [Pirellulales bacterium]|jgi:ethanolamine utilization protein EutN|nr:EutN/CcmL family microcompartment protein [Pirellulales bacterium]
MRIAQIIGTVTLSRCHESLKAGTFRLAAALSEEELLGSDVPKSDSLVVYDELGAGLGSRIAMSESREAAAPFYPEKKPIDAYNAAIIDQLNLESND